MTFSGGTKGLLIRKETVTDARLLKQFMDLVNAKKFDDLTAGWVSTYETCRR